VTIQGLGIALLALHIAGAVLVALAIPEARRRGSVAAARIYLLIAAATVAWIWKAMEWLA
jgi:hypothetical protein